MAMSTGPIGTNEASLTRQLARAAARGRHDERDEWKQVSHRRPAVRDHDYPAVGIQERRGQQPGDRQRYDHPDQGSCFSELETRLMELLDTTVPESATLSAPWLW